MNINYKLIGTRIKTHRRKLQLSQMQLAELSDLSVPYISYIETGKKKISLKALVSIANALNISPDILLTDHIKSEVNSDFSMSSILHDLNSSETIFIQDMLSALKMVLKTHNWLRDNN